MCSLLLKETVNHYVNNSTNGVYCVLIDASKAFDRLRHDRLFETLIKRGVPRVIIRFLLNSYSNQTMYVKWAAGLSEPSAACNGVKQGGIISPILFSLYMDMLLNALKERDIGCHIGNSFVGALAYADDLTLLSPSLSGLKSMLKTCEDFAKEFDIMYVCILSKPAGGRGPPFPGISVCCRNAVLPR